MRLAAIVRILTGILFVAEGLSKVTGDFVTGEFAKEVPKIAARSFPLWRHFLEAVVAPHATVFAWAVGLGELAVGLGLVLGLLTRVAAAGGALLMVSIALGAAKPGAGASWDDWITAGLTPKFACLLLLMLFAADAGRVWGFDGGRRRSPRGKAA